jgi:hypothetical protein
MPLKIAHISKWRSYEFIEPVIKIAKSFIIIENVTLKVNKCICNHYNT